MVKDPFISVVIPTRNAEDTIENCLKSLDDLDYPKDKMEIIIADGLSTDRTREVAQKYKANVISNHKLRVVSARNVGFEQAQGYLIAFSDADCVMDRSWLRNSVKYFDDVAVAGIGGPNLIPPNESSFARAVGVIFDCAFSLGGGAPTKIYDKVIESRAHGSNAIFRADVLRQVMPVDEEMFEGEDVVMNKKIEHLGYKLLYVPDVMVWHHRRTTPRRWWSQMYAYGLGKVLMGRNTPGTITPTQLALGFTVPVLMLICLTLVLLNPLFLLTFVAGSALLVSIGTSTIAVITTKSYRVAVNMPLATAILPVAWSCGFLRELVIPHRRTREERHRREP